MSEMLTRKVLAGALGFLLVMLVIVAVMFGLRPGGTGSPTPGPQIPPATSNSVSIELGDGNDVDITRRSDSMQTRIAVTVNAQDKVTVTRPINMHDGLPVDTSQLPPPNPGTAEFRVKPTSELPSDGGGAFRTVCDFAHFLFDDPIVYPQLRGQSHFHAFFGNSDATGDSTADSIKNSGNSTCRGGIANRSSYWVPVLLDMNTSPGKPLVPESINAYYKGGNFSTTGSADGYQPPVVFSMLPNGLRMITGWPTSTTAPNPTSLEFAVRWNCMDDADRQFGTSIPICKTGRLQQELFFPQCWDGVNLDSPDHKSHMSFGVNVRNAGDPRGWSHRECPATHPKVLPQIAYQVAYTPTKAQWGKLRLVSDVVLANPAGWTSHADYFEGWDHEVSDAFIKGCISANKDCHAHLLGDGRQIYGPP